MLHTRNSCSQRGVSGADLSRLAQQHADVRRSEQVRGLLMAQAVGSQPDVQIVLRCKTAQSAQAVTSGKGRAAARRRHRMVRVYQQASNPLPAKLALPGHTETCQSVSQEVCSLEEYDY